MKYPVILFDADGVMIKSSRLFSEQLELDYGIPVARMQPFFTGVFKLCSIGQADLKQELAKVIGKWGWKGTVEELMDFWFSKGTVIDQDVLSYVRELAAVGVRCFMATDQEKYRGEHLRQTIGNGNPFKEIFFSAEVGCLKKEEQFFEHIFAALQAETATSKEQVLFVDDSEKNVAVAQQFGFNGFLYTDLAGFKIFLDQA